MPAPQKLPSCSHASLTYLNVLMLCRGVLRLPGFYKQRDNFFCEPLSGSASQSLPMSKSMR